MSHRPPFTIVQRPLLLEGAMGTNKEGHWMMLLAEDQSDHELAVSIWHETMHTLLHAAGVDYPHDEYLVEAVAQRLAAACPEIVQLLRLRP